MARVHDEFVDQEGFIVYLNVKLPHCCSGYFEIVIAPTSSSRTQ